MFRNKKTGIFIVLFMLAVLKVSYADDIFYKLNKDLEQVGIVEFAKTTSAPFKNEIYHLEPGFKLGVGDTLIINLWGKIEDKYTLSIDKDGKILIPRIGSVYIMGNTLEDAKEKVRNALNQKYVNVQFDLGLGNVQDIRISVLGNVKKTGMYAINPFAKILDGLIAAGGPAENGSLKNIKLLRNDKLIAVFDYCQFVLKGEDSKNIALQHGDKIFVPLIENLVAIRGDIIRPGIYELNKESNLSDLVNAASGFIPSKFSKKIQILRLDKTTRNIVVAKELVFDDFGKIVNTKDDVKLEYNDTIIVTTEFSFTPFIKDLMKTVFVNGEVTIPGNYIIQDGEKISALIKRFGGLTIWAYPEGAILIRKIVKEKQDELTDNIVKTKEMNILEEEAVLAKAIIFKEEKEILQSAIDRKRKALNLFASSRSKGRIIIDLPKILKGEEGDIVLEKGDDLYIPSIPDWVLISGAVYNPESVVFKDGQKISYYLEIVGGPAEKANTGGIYIIKPNGNVITKLKGDEIISRGDIVVVPEKEETAENKK